MAFGRGTLSFIGRNGIPVLSVEHMHIIVLDDVSHARLTFCVRCLRRTLRCAMVCESKMATEKRYAITFFPLYA